MSRYNTRIMMAALVMISGATLSLAQQSKSLSERPVTQEHVADDMDSSMMNMSAMNEEAPTMAVAMGTLLRHRDWVTISVGSSTFKAFIVYPTRPGKAPVVLVTSNDQGLNSRMLSLTDQLAASGFIAIAPDPLSGMGPHGGGTESFKSQAKLAEALSRISSRETIERNNAARDYAIKQASANGKSATLALNDTLKGSPTIDVTVNSVTSLEHRVSLQLTGQALPRATAFMSQNIDNPLMMLAQAQAKQAHGGGASASVMTHKSDDLPASIYMSRETVAHTSMQSGWVDIPVGDKKIHTWVSYPNGDDKRPVVIVIHGAPGMWEDWPQAVADQLAREGFIGVAPDLVSGMAPNGGNWDSFPSINEAIKALEDLGRTESIRRLAAVRDYAMGLKRANGKSAVLGFCAGGNLSWDLAVAVPQLNAAIVYYGAAPNEASMAKIKAPVLGLYADLDPRTTATVPGTADEMKKLGKSFEYHIYSNTTHSFMSIQNEAGNFSSVAASWPKAIQFLKDNMESSTR